MLTVLYDVVTGIAATVWLTSLLSAEDIRSIRPCDLILRHTLTRDCKILGSDHQHQKSQVAEARPNMNEPIPSTVEYPARFRGKSSSYFTEDRQSYRRSCNYQILNCYKIEPKDVTIQGQ